jgi:hypothetical protein
MKVYGIKGKNPRFKYVAILNNVANVAAVISVVLAFLGVPHSTEGRALIVCAWTLLPPSWFFVETFWIHNEETDAGWEQLKFGQEQATKIWVAVVTVLFGLYFGKDFYLRSPSGTTMVSSPMTQNVPAGVPPTSIQQSSGQRFVVVDGEASKPTSRRRPSAVGFDTKTGRLCNIDDRSIATSSQRTETMNQLPKCYDLFLERP